MRTICKSARALALSLVAALLCAAAFSGSAAGAVWKFSGITLTGTETVVDHALESSLTIPGLTNTCKPFVYKMTIVNSAGVGEASITEVPLVDCFTNTKACSIESIAAEGLPWSGKLTKVSGSNYLVIKGIELDVLYGGEECVLGEIEAVIEGTAGGLIENATESTVFSASSFPPTGTLLGVFGVDAEWTGAFRMIAIGSHIGQSISVS